MFRVAAPFVGAMDAAKEAEHVAAVAAERGQASTSWAAAQVTEAEQRIEQSKSHWSIVSSSSLADSSFTPSHVAAANLAAFEELQRHPSWWPFFRTFGYDTQVQESSGTMEVGEKFAEGGQAELFHAKITSNDPKDNERDARDRVEWVLKVFKKGTLLRDLQKQWPHGFLKWRAQDFERYMSGKPPGLKFICDVMYGTLLIDGRFGFLMRKENMDLRSFIDSKMLEVGHGCGPFAKEKAEEIMYRIAEGLNWLHENGIVHRDLKASNVLVNLSGLPEWYYIYVADFECSVGVVGTGFFRAPEILQACKDRIASKREEVFTKAADVYSFGMICYEVLTGKLPFQDHPLRESRELVDLVINGLRPEIPEFVKDWMVKLLKMCWNSHPKARPSVRKIMSIFEANSKSEYVIEEVQEKRNNSRWKLLVNRFLAQCIRID